MKLVYINPNPSGAYPPIQEGNFRSVPPGMSVWPEELSTDVFYAHNGFVTLTVEEVEGLPTVTGCEPNLEAWEAWKASLPEPGEGEETEPPESEIEALRREFQEISANQAPIMAAARAYAATAVSISDTQALEMAGLFPTWAEVLAEGGQLDEGRVIEKDGTLYRVVQSVTPVAHQEPGGTGMLAIYRPIDKAHAGTAEDPIPWVYGMDCLAGLYYSYNGAIYRVAAGGNMIPCIWAPDSGIWQWEIITKGE